MENLTIVNMPKNLVFQFSEGRYIWKIDRNATRNGNYEGQSNEYTEVFDTYGDGSIGCAWSGKLTTNPGLFGANGLDKDGNFHIFSYDMDCGASFSQNMPLVLAKQDVINKIMAIEPITKFSRNK